MRTSIKILGLRKMVLGAVGILLCMSLAGCGAEKDQGTLRQPGIEEELTGKEQTVIAGGNGAPADSTVATGQEATGQEADSASATVDMIRFESKDLSGNYVNQDMLLNANLTVFNVWATYCGPCIREMPELGRLAEEYESKGVQFVGIVLDVYDADDTDYAEEIIATTGAGTYLHILASDSLNDTLLSEVQYVPTTFFMDARGNILYSVVGAMDYDTWVDYIDSVMADAE